MFKRFLVLLFLVYATSQAADVPPKPAAPAPAPAKPELRGVLTEEDFTKLESWVVKYIAADKVGGDVGTPSMAIRAITDKLRADPEGWTDAEYDAKVVSIRRVYALIAKSRDPHTNGIHAENGFYSAVSDFVTDSADQQVFGKRWTMQSKLLDLVGPGGLDQARRKETLDFMNNHPVLFPDIPSRIKFIDWLASVNIKTKGLNEIKADLVGAPPDDPKAKPPQKQK